MGQSIEIRKRFILLFGSRIDDLFRHSNTISHRDYRKHKIPLAKTTRSARIRDSSSGPFDPGNRAPGVKDGWRARAKTPCPNKNTVPEQPNDRSAADLDGEPRRLDDATVTFDDSEHPVMQSTGTEPVDALIGRFVGKSASRGPWVPVAWARSTRASTKP